MCSNSVLAIESLGPGSGLISKLCIGSCQHQELCRSLQSGNARARIAVIRVRVRVRVARARIAVIRATVADLSKALIMRIYTATLCRWLVALQDITKAFNCNPNPDPNSGPWLSHVMFVM